MPSVQLDAQAQYLLSRGEDFEFFAEEILGVRLNKAQKRLARRLKLGPDRKWPAKTWMVVAANQIGKTLFTGMLIMWGCMYKIGEPPIDQHPQGPQGWLNEQYLWIHLGPVQQQAYLAYKDVLALSRGEHPAQAGRSKLPKGLIEEAKVEKYYDGFVFWNGAQAHFRTAERKAEAVLGYRAAAISVDEAAFVDHLTETVNTVLYMRLIAAKGPLFLISTPNGMNDFYDFVDAVQQGGKDHQPEDSVWTYYDSVLVWAVIHDNLGYGLDDAEIERMERTLSPVTKEQQLRGAFLEPAEAFFVPQNEILKAFDYGMEPEERPIPGHSYAIYWDPSASGAGDPSAVFVLDVTELPWRGVYWKWYERSPGVTALMGDVIRLHNDYHGFRDERNWISAPSRAVTGFDATAMGGVIVKQLLAKVRPQRPLNWGGEATKLPSLIDLRNMLTRGLIKLPASWRQARQEILNYRLKDDKIRQDNVMALMGASVVAKNMTGTGKIIKADVKARTTPHKRRLQWR